MKRNNLILSVDTAFGVTGISLFAGGEELASFFDDTKNNQAKFLVQQIENVLSANELCYDDLSGFAVSIGPGGFTSIRVGMSCLLAMASATKKSIIGFSTLELMKAGYASSLRAEGVAAEAKRRPAQQIQATSARLPRRFAPRSDKIELCKGFVACVLPAGRDKYFVQSFGQKESPPQMIMSSELQGFVEGVEIVITTIANLEIDSLSVVFYDASQNAIILGELASEKGFDENQKPPLPLYIRPVDAKVQKRLLGNI